MTGERLIIRESCTQLVELIVLWRSRVLRCAWPEAVSGVSPGMSEEKHPTELIRLVLAAQGAQGGQGVVYQPSSSSADE